MKIFINYAYDGQALVKELIELLHSAGHSTSHDLKLMPNQDWAKELEAAIKSSDVMIYALSEDSVATEWCLWCFAHAVKEGKPIISVRLRKDVEAPEALKDFHTIQFTSKSDRQLIGLLSGALLHADAFIVPTTKTSVVPETPRGIPAQAMGTGAPPGMRPPMSGRQVAEE